MFHAIDFKWNEEEEEAIVIEELEQLVEKCKDLREEEYYSIFTIHEAQNIATALNLIEKQQEEIEKYKKLYEKALSDLVKVDKKLLDKENLEKEVADEIDKVAVELDKLSDNIYIVNQAMLLQKIASEKLGKFYID